MSYAPVTDIPRRGEVQFDKPAPRSSKLNLKTWGRKSWAGALIVAAIVIAAIVLGAVLGSRANRYPSYSKLHYSVVDTYEGTAFFDSFDFYTVYDPSEGFVHYVNQQSAVEQNLTYASANSVLLRVETTDEDASTGRDSVRITSKKQFDSGLFIFDILHTPYGCGTWPAIWTADPSSWPENGETDVLEAVNSATAGNQMTLHTSNGCTMHAKRKEAGKVLTSNCFNGTDSNAGCGVQGPHATFGEAFNNNGGGVYAMELRTAGIRVWFFGRNSIPRDISDGTSPDPSSWSTPLADFPSTDCSITDHFTNQSIIVNIDLCGSWAGEEKFFTSNTACASSASTNQGASLSACETIVATNATNFAEAYWELSSIKVYQSQ